MSKSRSKLEQTVCRVCSPTKSGDIKGQEGAQTMEISLAGLEEEFKAMTLNSEEPGRLTQETL